MTKHKYEWLILKEETMLKKILSLFKAKEEEIRQIGLAEAKKELSGKLKEETGSLEDMGVKQREEIEKTKELILERLTKLEHAKLRNSNLQPREIQFMEGNHENFLRLNRLFIRNMTQPPAESPAEYIAEFLEKLNNLRKSTKRSLGALMNYFKNESVAIAHAMNTLEKQIKSLEGLQGHTGLDDIKSLMTRIDVLDKRMASVDEAQKSIKKATDNATKLKKEFETNTKEHDAYKVGKEAKEHTTLIAKDRDLKEKIERVCSFLFHYTSDKRLAYKL